MKYSYLKTILFSALLICTVLQSQAAAVPVHDPSVIVVYKDANGNSYNENDANNTRTKYYYVFGTMLGAAYSTDMINWTSFTPTINLNGSPSTDYYQIFKDEADYAGHFDAAAVQGNLWAPDIIYNTAMGKWCMYFSLSGNDFKSSVILLTADEIDGPYTRQGLVVCGGFTNNQNDLGRQDYQNVMGTSTIPDRYLNNGTWYNDYAVSCIDPSILYDEDGQLWMNYGSWSGGIFLLKLDNNTGFRDNNYNYGYGSNPSWDGSRLRFDPYMGVHIGGGYYVSGEGPYIEYITDQNGTGYYYMFVSMGFYSPEGGYTMRVFRSSTINGAYTDVTGNDAVFAGWDFNYGDNTTYGFPIMQNYKWNWWELGEIAQGHNSVLQEEDGSIYLVYHRKMDNGTAWHNVEVHQLFFNEAGWPLSAPFEYREGFGLKNKVYDASDIAGLYGVITHDAVDYENLATNAEQQIYLTANGTIQGAYTGTWAYNYADGKQYITLTTNAGTFQGTVLEQLLNDISSKTISFTAMNSANERALWGYRYTNTKTTNTTMYNNGSKVIGATDYSLTWDAYDDFEQVEAADDFAVEFVFDNHSLVTENWNNWAIAIQNGTELWYLRADAFSVSTFTDATVGYGYDWDWDTEFKEVFKDEEVTVKIEKVGTVINVVAYVNDELVYTASTNNAPTGNYTVYLGGDATYLDMKKVSVSDVGARQLVGTVNDDGTYTSGFGVALGETTTVSGDFELNYNFNNYHNAPSLDNWDNYILRAVTNGQTSLLRADAYVAGPVGTMNHTYDWNWDNFIDIISGATVDLKISRVADVITYDAVITTQSGEVYHHTAVNSGASTADITYNFTGEESMVDLFEIENIIYVGTDCNGVNGGTAYFDNCETCVGGNTGEEACTQDCNGDWGGDAYTDNCTVCVQGNTGFSDCTGSIEAETACTFDGTIDVNNEGFNGDGFLNTTNAIGAYATWVLNSDQAQTATISFRYANGGTDPRNGTISINSSDAGILELPTTGAWSTWETVSVNLALVQGSNEIVVTAITADGLANLDMVHFSDGVSDANCLITGIDKQKETIVTVYPSPTSGLVNLSTSADWTLFNVVGDQLSNGTNDKVIDLSSFANGVYTIAVEGQYFQVIKE